MISCPNCNSALNLEQLTEDAACRRLFGAMGITMHASLMIAYLGLFKPRKQALRWSRAELLAKEVADTWGDDPRLPDALSKTVEALREKRQADGWKPLQSHSYLASVIESTSPALVRITPGNNRPTREQSLEQDLSDTSWAGNRIEVTDD